MVVFKEIGIDMPNVVLATPVSAKGVRMTFADFRIMQGGRNIIQNFSTTICMIFLFFIYLFF